jgi:hypothetical protein
MDYRPIKFMNKQRAVSYPSGYVNQGALINKNLLIAYEKAYFAVQLLRMLRVAAYKGNKFVKVLMGVIFGPRIICCEEP